MWLINCRTMQLEEHFGSKIPKYAILSHTWGDDEVSFADFTQDLANAMKKQAYAKIAFTCGQALQDKLNYAWVDTCCINKSSSAELSEAINSMFDWYGDSWQCYVYLQDVLGARFEADFRRSRWFTRGWTLQELIAPKAVQFYDRDWFNLGTKYHHIELIEEITGVDQNGLRGRLNDFCVARKMSWASERKTTRVEDMAYCLLGIFDVNMPLLYGEGSRAFARLQEEIIRSRDDDSIFAWGLNTTMQHRLGLVPDLLAELLHDYETEIDSCLLPDSPAHFEPCRRLEHANTSPSSWTMTSTGLQMQLPLVRIQPPLTFSGDLDLDNIFYLGLLSCSQGSISEWPGIVLRLVEEDADLSKRLERVYIWGSEYMCTVLVGPKAVAQSVMEHVTIVRDLGHKLDRGADTGHFHVLVHPSDHLEEMGYTITDGVTVKACDTSWNSNSMQLTVRESYKTIGCLKFFFYSHDDDWLGAFVVFINTSTKKMVVRPRDTTIFDSNLQDPTKTIDSKNPDEMVAVDSRGNVIQIKIDIKDKIVYGLHIFELHIDACARALPVSLPESHWYWIWKRRYQEMLGEEKISSDVEMS